MSFTLPDASAAAVAEYLPKDLVEKLLQADKTVLCDLYWQRHPRFRFLKSVPPRARMLDVGCGSGGVSFWLRYLSPLRDDIELHGIDIAKGEHAHLLASFSRVDLNTDPLPFATRHLHAAMSAHVLEHLSTGSNVLGELARCMCPGAELYIEVPSPASAITPPASVFKQAGWPMMISNFFDDTTHIKLWESEELVAQAMNAGFVLRDHGVVKDRFLEDTLMATGIARQDEELLLYGFWSRANWSSYYIFKRNT